MTLLLFSAFKSTFPQIPLNFRQFPAFSLLSYGIVAPFFSENFSLFSNYNGSVIQYAASESECALLRMDAESPGISLAMSERVSVHAQVDENGVYLSVGNNLYCLKPEEQQVWEHLADAGEEVLSLRYADGRLLVVTNSRVLSYREDGAWGTIAVDGGSYFIADLAGEYLLVAQSSRPMLSVLQWRNMGEAILNYYSPVSMGAHLHSDLQTAMLFDLRGFRIYNMDGSYTERALERPEEIQDLAYQRFPV